MDDIAAKLKNLETRISKLEAEAREQERIIQEAKDAKGKMIQQSLALRSEMQRLEAKTKDPVVTEHALLRYVERVMGIPRKELVDAILTEQVKLQYKTLGNGKFPIDGGRVLIKNGKVVTVLGNKKDV